MTADQGRAGDVTTQQPRRRYLTQEELDKIKRLCAEGEDVPASLARRLLTDREDWVKRAYDTKAKASNG